MNPQASMGYSLSASGGQGGAAGPSTASGSFFNSFGGMDGSDWTVNFGAGNTTGLPATTKAAAPSVAVPASLGVSMDQFGLPNNVAVATSANASAGVVAAGTQSVSPVVLVVAVIALAVLAKRHG